MESRTCPYCNYKYSRLGYVKKLTFKAIWSKWKCPQCENKITFDTKRRVVVAGISAVWILIVNLARRFFETEQDFWIIYFILLFGGVMYICGYDKFVKAKN
jgi:CXXC-20-CXXC protein